MKLLKKGAEADIYETTWRGIKSIAKIRKVKSYRNAVLDKKLRKQRTIREAEIISYAKNFGIHSPLVYFVDTNKSTIFMQYIPGIPIHDLTDSKIINCCKDIGKIVATMHKNGLIHGDLTTSNFILFKNQIYVIDFGLSQKSTKSEDYAVDLRLIKEILNSAHAHIMEKSWRNFLIGYKSVIGTANFNKVTNLVSIIESRGRYATVV